MTTIVSWNIQNGLGFDEELSLKRISDTVRDICTPDVICFQEVSNNVLLPDGSFSDQVLELTKEFKEHIPFFGAAMDVFYPDQNRRGQYGNMILSRYPLSSLFCHSLPQPSDGIKKQMPRQMTEVTIRAPSAPIRIMTTHLEFHSQVQRLAQSKRIMEIESDICKQIIAPPAFTETGPYARFDRSLNSILCGDFNFLPNSEEYNIIVNPMDGQIAFNDVWKIVNSDQPHAPTCGIFDAKQWPEGPHCRDYFFVSDELKDCIEDMFVETKTSASDHQPLVLNLEL